MMQLGVLASQTTSLKLSGLHNRRCTIENLGKSIHLTTISIKSLYKYQLSRQCIDRKFHSVLIRKVMGTPLDNIHTGKRIAY